MTVVDKRIVFRDEATAYLFAHHFLKRQMEHWGGYEAVTRYRLFADVLKIALAKNIIFSKELMGNEESIVQKLEKCSDLRINKILLTLKNKDLSILPKQKKTVQKKFRYVDPFFLHAEKPIRLSHVNKIFRKELEDARLENSKGIHAGRVK